MNSSAESISKTAQGATASALAFDAPLTLYQPEIVLNRDSRGIGAFMGFEDSSITTSYTLTNDRQTTDFTDRYRKETFIETVGVTRR